MAAPRVVGYQSLAVRHGPARKVARRVTPSTNAFVGDLLPLRRQGPGTILGAASAVIASERAPLGGQAATMRYTTLDALRGVAAVAVMFFHAGLVAPLALPGGYLAVDLFFVLSGFVIARAYLHSLREHGPMRFARRRLARLYPMYATGIVVGAIGSVALAAIRGESFSLLAVASAFVLIPWPNPGYLYPVNPPAWSLASEVVVNAALALGRRRTNPRSLAAIIAGSAVVLLAVAVTEHRVSEGAYWARGWIGLVRAVFAFSAGIAISLLPAHAQRASRPWVLLLPVSLIGLMTLNPADRGLLDLACITIVFPAMVWLGSRFEIPGRRAFGPLAEASYPLYCIHFMPVVLAQALARRAPEWAGIIGLTTCVVTLVAAWALARWLDRPAEVRLRGWLLRPAESHRTVAR